MTHERTSRARVVARLAKQVERALAELELSPAQYRLLTNLADGPSQASTLAERLIVSRPSVTALADGLVERGLVTRRGAPADRRRVMHVLTGEGRRVLAAADAAIERRLVALASFLPAHEQARAWGGLECWGRALDRSRAEAVSRAAGSGTAPPAARGAAAPPARGGR